jgi:prevent-host-death family protein
MRTVELEEARANLSELIESASAGEEIIITKGAKPVARLSAPAESTSLRDLKPSSVGGVLRPITGGEDDILDEMLNP